MVLLTREICSTKTTIKKTKFTETENRWVVARGSMQGVGKRDKGAQKVQTSSYKLTSLGDVIYSMVFLLYINIYTHT